jgi:hypothetical protein
LGLDLQGERAEPSNPQQEGLKVRTIFRLCLVAAIVAAIGLVAVPVASASAGATGHASITSFEKKQNKRIKKAKKKAAKAHERIEAIKDWNFTQDERLGSAEDLLGTIVTGALQLVSVIQDQIVPSLQAINTALQDPTTGLVGLNLARPQFGVFEPDGTFLGGTSDAGSEGPDDDATVSGGFYVIDFTNDVSTRVYSVNVFPAGPGVAPPVTTIGSCATPGIDALCEGLETDSGGDPNEIVVQFGTGGAPPATPFTVTAISG